MNAESTTSQSKRFTSYERSAQTGLDYAVNRTYDSKLGRFTQGDPIGMSAVSLGSPQTLNLYTYCGNDPINHTDPDGLFFGSLFKWIGKIFKAVNKILKWVVIAVVIVTVAIAVFHSGGAALGFLKAIMGIVGKILGVKVTTSASIFTNFAGEIVVIGLTSSISIGVSGQIIAGLYAVGAIANSFTKIDDKEKDQKWGRAFLQALRILQNNEVCSSYIADNSKTSDINSVNPAQDLWSRSQNGKIRDADSYNVTDNSGREGLAATKQTADRFTGRVKSTGDTTLGLIFYDDVGLKKALGISADAGRVEIMLHELKHALGGVHNGTKEEATWRETFVKNVLIPIISNEINRSL